METALRARIWISVGVITRRRGTRAGEGPRSWRNLQQSAAARSDHQYRPGKLLCALLDEALHSRRYRPRELIVLVHDSTGNDFRYAIDDSKRRRELGCVRPRRWRRAQRNRAWISNTRVVGTPIPAGHLSQASGWGKPLERRAEGEPSIAPAAGLDMKGIILRAARHPAISC